MKCNHHEKGRVRSWQDDRGLFAVCICAYNSDEHISTFVCRAYFVQKIQMFERCWGSMHPINGAISWGGRFSECDVIWDPSFSKIKNNMESYAHIWLLSGIPVELCKGTWWSWGKTLPKIDDTRDRPVYSCGFCRWRLVINPVRPKCFSCKTRGLAECNKIRPRVITRTVETAEIAAGIWSLQKRLHFSVRS